MNDNIGNRMKSNYEVRSQTHLLRRTPVIIRLDGNSFHKYTKNFKKPFDLDFRSLMVEITRQMLKKIGGAKAAYCQSDEISILLIDYDKLQTQAWVDYNVQKVTSLSASMITMLFNWYVGSYLSVDGDAMFDSRCFNVPREEVLNYFIWRQKDWIRNSIQMYGRSHFSQKELMGKKSGDIINMLKEEGCDWFLLPNQLRFGDLILNISNEERENGVPDYYNDDLVGSKILDRGIYCDEGKEVDI